MVSWGKGHELGGGFSKGKMRKGMPGQMNGVCKAGALSVLKSRSAKYVPFKWTLQAGES